MLLGIGRPTCACTENGREDVWFSCITWLFHHHQPWFSSLERFAGCTEKPTDNCDSDKGSVSTDDLVDRTTLDYNEFLPVFNLLFRFWMSFIDCYWKGLWRHSWTILRSSWAIQGWIRCSGNKLSLHGWLRWSGFLQRRDISFATRSQGKIKIIKLCGHSRDNRKFLQEIRPKSDLRLVQVWLMTCSSLT